jgi:hypothetical protein
VQFNIADINIWFFVGLMGQGAMLRLVACTLKTQVVFSAGSETDQAGWGSM